MCHLLYLWMQHVRSPVSTLCVEQAASMDSLLLVVGRSKREVVIAYARVMIHQHSRGATSQASDIAIHACEILDMRAQLSRFYVKHTNHIYEKIGASSFSHHQSCFLTQYHLLTSHSPIFLCRVEGLVEWNGS